MSPRFLKGSPGPRRQVAVAGGVDEHLGLHREQAGFGRENRGGDFATFGLDSD